MSIPSQSKRDPVITVRVSEELNQKIDEVWEERGYSSRSEFIRDALRSAIDPQVTISEEFMEHLMVSQRQRDMGETVSLDELE